ARAPVTAPPPKARAKARATRERRTWSVLPRRLLSTAPRKLVSSATEQRRFDSVGAHSVRPNPHDERAHAVRPYHSALAKTSGHRFAGTCTKGVVVDC